MNADKFIWTSEDYTCEELRDQFDNKFPVIALVTTGYYGDHSHERLTEDTILRIQDWGTQQRVVAKDHRGRFITLPVKYPVKVQQLLKTLEPVGKYQSIQQFLENHVIPKTVQLDKDEVEKLYTGERKEMFGILELLHVYAEKFFKANVFKSGSLTVNETYMIPVHLGMRFKVALGMKASSADDWTNWFNGINRTAERVDFNSVNGVADIFIYNREAEGWDFNKELPVYHVRHPLTLGKGMDQYSWNMCIPSPRRDGGYIKTETKKPVTNRDDLNPRFNAITGMKQPTMTEAVHNELIEKLSKSPKRKEMVTKPGDFAERHQMLEAIYRPRAESISTTTTEKAPETDVIQQRSKNFDEAARKIFEQKRNEYFKDAAQQAVQRQESQERQSDTESELYEDGRESPEYDTRLAPTEDNARYGSHYIIQRNEDQDTRGQTRKGLYNRDNRSRDQRYRDQQSHSQQLRVAEPESYSYGKSRKPAYSDSWGDVFAGQTKQERGAEYSYSRSDRNVQPESHNHERFLTRPPGDNSYYPPGRPGHLRIAEVESYTYSGRPAETSHSAADRNRTPGDPILNRFNIPQGNFSEMTAEDVAGCLKELGMERYIPRFLELEVDGLILMNLTRDDLKRDFSVTGLDAMRLLKFAQEGWKTN